MSLDEEIQMKRARMALVFGCGLGLSLQTLAQDTSGRKEFAPPEKDFSILLPSKPETKTQTGSTSTTTRYAAGSGAGAYVVARQSYSVDVSKGRTVEEILDLGRDGAVSQMRGKLVSETKIKLQDKHPGRELRIALPDGQTIFRVRAYWANQRTYFVMVAGAATLVDSKDAKQFLDSFKVMDAK
jgi:hypothetical protein